MIQKRLNLLWACLLSAACGTGQPSVKHTQGVSEHHRSAQHWVQSMPDKAMDQVLLSAEEIRALNQKNAAPSWGHQDILGASSMNQEHVTQELTVRSQWLEKRVSDGKYVEEPKGMLRTATTRVREATVVDEFRVIHTQSTLYCVPSENNLYTVPIDRDFNRNHCSGLHPGEAVRVLRRTNDGWLHVHVGHSVGWVRDSETTPPVPLPDLRKFLEQRPRIVVLEDNLPLPAGTTLRWVTHFHQTTEHTKQSVWIPTANGLARSAVAPIVENNAASSGPRWSSWPIPFTRRNIVTLALSMRDTPYGWGGRAGGRDCSRFLLDLFGSFGVRLGRHSTAQSKSGSHQVELTGLSVDEKKQRIIEAGNQGVVLLYMPGHIMLYLGQGPEGPLAVSSLSEYALATPGGVDEIIRIDRVVVTGMELGYRTQRGSFLERLQRLAVFGP